MTRHLRVIIAATVVAAAAAAAPLEATGSASRSPRGYAPRRSRSLDTRRALLDRSRLRDADNADDSVHTLRLRGGASTSGVDACRRVDGVDGWRRLGGGDGGGERHEFKAEIKQLMSLIINAFYSNKEIFLRELISNAADAIDKIRHQALSDALALEADTSLHISLIPDEASKTLTIRDTGVGMTKEELEHNLGTIAHSGTKAFMEAMQQGKAELPLIGQFGVGFYSAFLVADFVEVFSKSNADSRVWRWSSDAGGSFTIEEATYDELPRGTAVVLHLKEDQLDLLNPHKLRELVRLHSEFITHPIRLWLPAPPSPPATSPTSAPSESTPAGSGDGSASADVRKADDDDGDAATVEDVPPETGAAEDAAAVENWETLNEQPPIWMQPPSELSDADYAAFYQAVTGDFEEPLITKHFSVEGQIDMRGLLFVPRRAPFDVFDREKRGNKLRLYVRRVFVSDECEDLCPEWLGFLRGVVDSDDLPLNVSREMLQQSKKLLQVMRRNIVKKAIEMLTELASTDEEKYMHFYSQFSKNLKLGIHEEAGQREKLARLLRYRSSASGGNQTSLAEYVSRMQPNQTDIYYIAGESVEAVADSPFVEPLRARGLEVIYMTDPIDEYAMQSFREFDGHRFVCITKAGLDLGTVDGDTPQPDAEEAKRLQTLCNVTKKLLTPQVHRVTLSSRLSSSPCVLVTDEWGWSANMERIMRAQALRDPSAAGFMSSPKTLELNPRHPIVRQLAARAAEEAAAASSGSGGDGGSGGGLAESVQLLYETALIGSGFSIDKPNAFTGRIHRLMELALTDDAHPAPSVDGLRADAPA